MNITQFAEKIQDIFPVARKENEDFRDALSRVLKEYKKLVDSLDDQIKKTQPDWATQNKRIDQLIIGIKKCVNSYYKGARNTSYVILLNQMVGIATITGIFTSIEQYVIKQGEYLWRGRVFDDKRNRTHEDMFHIPFEKRGFVKTQRYSATGYPCLYLGTTIYSCWEELERPRFDDLMISGFCALHDIKLLNLCRPEANEYDDNHLMNLLLRLPLILSCSFEIGDEDKNADFKPEYIIPQMLIEILINQNNKKRTEKHAEIGDLILGIIYTSTRINNDFGYGLELKLFRNIAMPAIDVSIKSGHCGKLADCFLVTKPTCNEYESLKRDVKTTFLYRRATSEDEPYTRTSMGVLEDTIKNTIKLQKIEYIYITDKNGKRFNEIHFPTSGGTTTVIVRSNTEWDIKGE